MTGAALAALMVAAPFGSAAMAAETGNPAAAATSAIPFDIPAQNLDGALTALADRAGLQILFTSEQTAGAKSAALNGTYTPSEALERLLAGTGLTYEFTDARTVTLRPAPQTGDTLLLPTLPIYGLKTTTTLNDTAASVGIVTAKEIEESNLRSFRGAFRMLGNVMDADWPDAGFIIRGVNSEGLTPGGAPLATLYIDGVPQTVNGARRGARGLWDVEQLEVYRGPQSTLTGRAALAGAVYIKTADPTFDWETKAQATVATMETRGGAFTLNGPLLEDQIAFRVSAEYQSAENDINYPTYVGYNHYDEFVEDEYYQIRGKLLLAPANLPDTTGLLTYSFSHDSPYIDDIAGPVLGFSYDEHRGDFNMPVFAESRSTDNRNLSFELKHNFSDELMLTSLSTYTSADMNRPSINEGTAGETNVTMGYNDQTILSQEFRLNYDTARLASVLGIYLAREKADGRYDRPDYFGNVDLSVSNEDLFNAALFGEATYEFVPTWKIVLGGRVDYTDKENFSFYSRNGITRTNQTDNYDETVLLPKIGLLKEVAPGHVLGLTVQEGFRPGGASVQRSTGESYDYDPEYAWNYELSYKGAFLAERLLLSANLFYVDWKDQQVEYLEDPLDFNSDRVTNAASSASKGFEIEARYAVTKGLSTFASIGYVDTEFEDFDDASLGNLSGYPFPEAPKWNLGFGGQYVSDSGFHIGADAKYVSSYLARFGSDPQEYLDGYWVANAQFGYSQDAWDVTIFAENLFNKEYYVYNDRDTTGDVAATLGPRQVVGVVVTTKF